MRFRWWLFTTISLFTVGLLFGVGTYSRIPDSLGSETADFQKLSEMIISLPPPLMMTAIFFKNTLAIASSIVLSPIFLMVPVLTLLLNGWLIGLISVAAVNEQSIGYLLAGIIPHGVFELPALFMGEAMAFSIGVTVIRALFKNQAADLKISIKHDMRFLFPVLILFAVAAAVETYVTPVILKLAM